MSLSLHAAKSVSFLCASSHALRLRVSLSSVVEMSSRDILPYDTSASLAESNTSSSPPLATTSSAERTSTLPSELHLDLRPVPEPELEEEEEMDCERYGEGDLAHLPLVGECATELAGDIEGMPSSGHSSATHLVCLGTVEVEADRPMLTATAVLPPCCERFPPSANLQPSCGCRVAGCV